MQFKSAITRIFSKANQVSQKAILIVVIVFTVDVSFAQSKNVRFFLSEIENIAYFAHPFSDRLKRQSEVYEYETYIDVMIKYTDSTTKLRFFKGGTFPYYFSNMQVISDTDFFTPFNATNRIKNVAIAIAEESNKGKNQVAKDKLAQVLYSKIKTLNGMQIAFVYLNMNYLSFY